MTSPKHAFSADIALVLRNADQKIRGLSGNSSHIVYHFWRVTMAKIARVDAFYVGFFRPDHMIVYPYSFEDGYDPPEELCYSDYGLCAWILKHRKPYFYRQDNGLLLHNGQNFGNLARVSADAVVIPLLEPRAGGGQVIGMASMQSYQALTYTDEHVRAFQWLANSVSVVRQRSQEDAINRRGLGFEAALETPEDSVASIIAVVNYRLREWSGRALQMQKSLPDDGIQLREDLDGLMRDCERLQTEIMELLLQPAARSADSMSLLTPKEKEVALLVVQGLTNKQIAAQLGIEVSTAKQHVSNVMAKLEVKQRSLVAVKLNLLL